ncbi:sugar transferase [Xanthomarina gelatinilytica]|uniref:sugar transferase n=1 Tax=Xanthomarina gelatinilytica TaxID=1137281 RepID=UPI003AA902D7
MKKILYIGEDQELHLRLGAEPNLTVDRVSNVVGFSNALESLEDLDFVLSDYKLKGLNGTGIFEKFREHFSKHQIPFGLVVNHPEKKFRVSLLKSGISEVYPSNVNAETVVSRINFLKEMLESRLSTAKKVEYQEYHIPLSKRIFDLVVAGCALVVFSPIMILTAIAIKIESPGSIWYVSKRVGTGYRVFDFYKLRSMYMDADKRVADMKHLNQYAIEAEESGSDKFVSQNKQKEGAPTLLYKDGQPMSEEEYLVYKKKQQAGTFVKFKDDPRVTKVGKFIRNTSIDELPQLINVVKGDMSIVGNRPLPLYEAEQLTSDDWGERFLAPAGITGLWQVMKRGKGEMSDEERKALDNQYARKVSLWNDIRLILRTVPALFQKENV